MSIYFMRHGETKWNKERKLQGITDVELSEKGINQAKISASVAQPYHFDYILSSPLKRALETANIIGDFCNCPVIVNDGLIERNMGKFEGTDYESVPWKCFWSLDMAENIYQIEKCEDFMGRVKSTITSITNEYKGKKILIVSHGAFYRGIRNLDIKLEDIEARESANASLIENCKIIKILD